MWMGIAVVGLALILGACRAPQAAAPTVEPKATTVAATSTPTSTPVPIKALKVAPEVATPGTQFTVNGEGLAPQKTVQFMWDTYDAKYETKLGLGSIEFLRPAYTKKVVSIGEAATDAQGRVTATLKVPDDEFGELHDIVARVDGQDVARGGIYIRRTVTISPSSGPVGTLVTVEVKGLGYTAFTSTAGLRWDNGYVGFLSSTTTRGTARGVFRASGPVGQHTIDIDSASAAVPYLNSHQTLTRKYKIPSFRFPFNVTADNGAPPNTVEWPDTARVSKVPTLPISTNAGPAGATAVFSSTSGPILSKPTLTARAMTAGASVDLVWMTVTGSDVSGWKGSNTLLGTATVDSNGLISTPVTIPDELGGWHSLQLIQGDKVLSEVPYYVERSLYKAPPAKVKAGEPFKLEIRGVGWTELDNGVAVLYDNNYVGYACGFGSGGSVEVELTATGGPGTHLIDLYPMIYNRAFSAKHQWNYQMPQLTYAQDHPGLALGYKLPVFRLAIEVVP